MFRFFDSLHEIFLVIRKNMLRSILTGFSVAWGIFMFIILLGAGNGLENGIKYQFRSAMHNSLWIFAGQTTIDHDGLKKGRRIEFKNEDFTYVKNKIKGIDLGSSRYTIQGSRTIAHGKEYGVYEIRTALPDYRIIENINVIEGRFLNHADGKQYRKVAVISTDVKKGLFKESDPIGKFVTANGVNFRVIGVFEDIDDWDNNRCIYVPVSTAQKVFSGGDKIQMISVTTGDASLEESKTIEADIRTHLASKHRFNPQDPRAMHIGNNLEQFEKINSVITSVTFAVWVIGIFTIIAGIVGISNIMTITVKERTKEFGVRKAIGAQPLSIINNIILESVILTGMAGYIGLLAGIGLLELANNYLPKDGFFINPNVDIILALKMTILLIIAGTLAGLFPAMKAAQIRPIVALKDE